MSGELAVRIRSVLSVVVVSVALLALVAPTADAGPSPDVNTVVVHKEVVGPVPPGAVFEVLLTCSPLPTSPAAETIAPVTFMFDETGAPIGDNSVGVGMFEQCSIEETVTNGADVSYSCAMAFPVGPLATAEANSEGNGVAAQCTGDQSAEFYQVAGAQASFVVVNSFDDPPPPPPDVDDDDDDDDDVADDDVVAATPTFTG